MRKGLPDSGGDLENVPNDHKDVWADDLREFVADKGNQQAVVPPDWGYVDEDGMHFACFFLFRFHCLSFIGFTWGSSIRYSSN